MFGDCPGGATAAQPICNRQVGGFESPPGLQRCHGALCKVGMRFRLDT